MLLIEAATSLLSVWEIAISLVDFSIEVPLVAMTSHSSSRPLWDCLNSQFLTATRENSLNALSRFLRKDGSKDTTPILFLLSLTFCRNVGSCLICLQVFLPYYVLSIEVPLVAMTSHSSSRPLWDCLNSQFLTATRENSLNALSRFLRKDGSKDTTPILFLLSLTFCRNVGSCLICLQVFLPYYVLFFLCSSSSPNNCNFRILF